MGILTSSQAFKVIDELVTAYNRALGSSGSGMGLGDGSFGMSAVGPILRGLIEGSGDSTFCDADLQKILAPLVIGLQGQALATAVFPNIWGPFVSAISTVASNARVVDASITNLDSFLAWYNYLNPSTHWNCLCPPEWYNVSLACFGGIAPKPKNIYFPVTLNGTVNGETFTHALGQVTYTTGSAGSFVAGKIVDITKYAGGFAYLKWTGGSGSGAWSVTVTGLDQDGNAETFTYSSGSSIGSAGSVVMVPTNRAWSLVSKVTAIVATGVTGALFSIEGHAPSGRTYPLV